MEAAGGTAAILFHTNYVDTVIQLPAKICTKEKKQLRKPPKQLVFIVADDDGAMRTAAKSILKHAQASAASVILGADFESTTGIVPHIQALAAEYGEERIVGIFDQNMDFPGEVKIRGQQIIRDLGGTHFKGLLCIRSGQTDPESVKEYVASGAKLVLHKAGSDLHVHVLLDKIANCFGPGQGEDAQDAGTP